MTESPQFVGVKSVLLFFVWIVAVVVVFRPLSYLFIALSVAVGAAITEFVAARSNVRVGSSWLTSIVPMALLFAFIASAAIAGMFYLLELVNGITGPAPSRAAQLNMGYDQMGVFLQQGIGVKQDRKAADLAKDEVRAACYKILSDESDEDKTKKFSNINIICPLPPQKMPGT